MRHGWLQRRYLWYFKRQKVLELQSKRSGKCVRCGDCCGHCMFNDRKRGVCRIYAHRPAVCRMYPLTPEDLNHTPECGFSFKE
jgi:hypothetical protein